MDKPITIANDAEYETALALIQKLSGCADIRRGSDFATLVHACGRYRPSPQRTSALPTPWRHQVR